MVGWKKVDVIAGFPLSLQYYAHRIHDLLSQLTQSEDKVLTSNWAYVDSFMGSTAIHRVETLLAGAYNAKTDTEWDRAASVGQLSWAGQLTRGQLSYRG